MIGLSRDAYYKHFKRAACRADVAAKVVELARNIRTQEPRAGCRKIHQRITPQLRGEGMKAGRDKVISILGEHGMHVEPKKKHEKTTYSKHEYAVAPNRIKELTVERPNQVFVADITYLHTWAGVVYLFLVTDLFSRKIVGWHLSKNLLHCGAMRALEMALKEVPDPRGLIHHSDRGCQYCCHEFLALLGDYGITPSMTDADHCYQNAVAERVNGILKIELYLDSTFRNYAHALKATADAVRIYDTVRTHWSLGLRTPEEVYANAA